MNTSSNLIRKNHFNNITKFLYIGFASIAFGVAAQSAIAEPISATYVNTTAILAGRCIDPLPDQALTHELGTDAFAADELIAVSQATNFLGGECGLPGPVGNFTAQITITNVSNQAWKDLYFVTDTGGFNSGGFDGQVNGYDAFKIDNVGNLRPLVSESINTDGIFQIGEIWVFDFYGLTEVHPVSQNFASIGIGAVSSPASTASIVANPAVPVPSAAWLFGTGLIGLIGISRRKTV